jgi:hypothetical protein
VITTITALTTTVYSCSCHRNNRHRHVRPGCSKLPPRPDTQRSCCRRRNICPHPPLAPATLRPGRLRRGGLARHCGGASWLIGGGAPHQIREEERGSDM